MNNDILPFAKDLIKNQDPMIFIDVGSRNAILELADIADHIHAFGFEPNPVEYKKIIKDNTDRQVMTGLLPPRFKKQAYAPYALSNFQGKSDFYITPGPGACGMLEPDPDRLAEIKFKGIPFKKSFWHDTFYPYEVIETDVNTLDNFAKEHSLDHIDYMKIDVEGSEYEVLDGGHDILNTTGVIKVETCFIPFRKNQKLFSHVDILLREHGFDLLRYEIVQLQLGYKERTHPVDFIYGSRADIYGQPLSCDAIYVNRGVTDPKRALAQAIILLEKGYVDEALFILKNKTDVRDARLFKLLHMVTTYIGPTAKLRRLLDKWLDKIDAWGRKLKPYHKKV